VIVAVSWNEPPRTIGVGDTWVWIATAPRRTVAWSEPVPEPGSALCEMALADEAWEVCMPAAATFESMAGARFTSVVKSTMQLLVGPLGVRTIVPGHVKVYLPIAGLVSAIVKATLAQAVPTSPTPDELGTSTPGSSNPVGQSGPTGFAPQLGTSASVFKVSLSAASVPLFSFETARDEATVVRKHLRGSPTPKPAHDPPKRHERAYGQTGSQYVQTRTPNRRGARHAGLGRNNSEQALASKLDAVARKSSPRLRACHSRPHEVV
jgi:hypothetical protein